MSMTKTKTKTPYPVDPFGGFAAAELLDAKPTREDAIRLLGNVFDRLLRRNPPPGSKTAKRPFVDMTRGQTLELLSLAIEALRTLADPRSTLTADELPRRRTTPPPPFHLDARARPCWGYRPTAENGGLPMKKR